MPREPQEPTLPDRAVEFDHLKVPPGGLCWWCQVRPATTGEHKFKRSDLARLMGDDSLIWGDGEGNWKEIKGKSGITRDRHGVVKFPKSMCCQCNNTHSQPFDNAYDTYAVGGIVKTCGSACHAT